MGIHDDVCDGKLQKVKKAITENRALLRSRDRTRLNKTPTHLACGSGNLEMINTLLEFIETKKELYVISSGDTILQTILRHFNVKTEQHWYDILIAILGREAELRQQNPQEYENVKWLKDINNPMEILEIRDIPKEYRQRVQEVLNHTPEQLLMLIEQQKELKKQNKRTFTSSSMRWPTFKLPKFSFLCWDNTRQEGADLTDREPLISSLKMTKSQ